MAAVVKSLGLYDLLAPQFLAGFQFPDYIDKYLSLLAVADLQTTSDPNAILYTGTVYFPTGPGNPPVLQHQDPSGAIFDFHDVTMQFRLLIPRVGSTPVKTIIDTLANVNVPNVQRLQQMQQIANSLGPQPNLPPPQNVPTDYPGIGFQLELLLTLLTFHLGEHWKPGVINSDFTIAVDPNAKTSDVRILMPKVLLRYTQGQNVTQAPTFQVAAWGNPGFDAPNDLAEGELATMDPPLAIHSSGRVAFGINEIVLDLSEDNTPPEILDHFGVGQDFEGLYIKALQVYYTDTNKDFALNFAVRDALISFEGHVWLEAELDLLFADAPFGVAITIYDGNRPVPFNAGTPSGSTWTGGSATIPPTAVIYAQVSGGTPPFTTSVDFTPDGGSVQHLWNDQKRLAQFDPPPKSSETGTLVVQVTDASGTPQTYTNTLALTVAVAGASPAVPQATSLAQAQWQPDSRPAGIPDDYQIEFTPSTSGTSETLVVLGGVDLPDAKVGSPPTPYPLGNDRQVIVDVEPGDSLKIEADYKASTLPDTFRLRFAFEKPETVAQESAYSTSDGQPLPLPPPEDPVFPTNTVPDGVPGGTGHMGADALRYWTENALNLSQPITITGKASNEGIPSKGPYNEDLSQRRGDIAHRIVAGVPGANPGPVDPQGQKNSLPDSDPADRVAIVQGTPKSSKDYKLSGTLTRDKNPVPPYIQPPNTPPAPPGPPANSKPAVLRRLSIRVRLERNIPVLVELSGEIDFETETEKRLRNASGDNTSSLDLKPTAAATKNPNPADGVVDFTINVTYDLATHDLTETLTLGAAPADIDGLLRMTNPGPPYNTLKNILGAVLVFTPILDAAVKAIDPASAGDWTAIAVELGVPVAIGGLGFINTTDITLYGGQLQLRENIPGGSDPVKFTNAALTFDYGVSFRLDVDALNIHSSRSMSVRYKAVGVNLHFGDPPKFQFVLDTSKGYALDLSDPSLFNLPAPLGDLLKIAAARIARFNPLTLELDLEIKADLGIITVDKFMVKIPLDGASSPMILPSGVKVNIPAALIGSGSVKVHPGGFEGTIDLTIVPVKLRVAASVGVDHITQPPREVTAFFLGLEVDFPSPIILGATGMGLFGLFGLFGMHYAQIEDPPIPGDVVGPDLRWLMASGGAPYKLQNKGVELWGPKIDHWAFGVGAVLGTVDGFLLNMRGMFILELPGPRIMITVNLKIIESLGGLSPDGMDATELDVGIIGVLDLDFGAGQITLGVLIDLEVSQAHPLVSVQIPVQLFFDWNNPSQWHLWLGTTQTPASANILGIVRGGGYFMIGGDPIHPFPPDSDGTLPGVAVALGIFAAIIWGSEDVGIYLKVAVSADFGVSFSPHLFIVGHVSLEGELRLIIIGISVTGDFLVKAPDPLSLAVHVCASIWLFFFKISACVDFTIGDEPQPPAPPPLITRMYLQSFAPVIASGQGGDRPIDASLGDGVLVAASGLPQLSAPASPGTPVEVPIDTVPVLQMQYGVDASAVTQTFTAPIPACPTYPGAPGVSLGGGRSAQYKLQQILIDPPLPVGTPPPAAWRPNKPAKDTSQTQVDLALFSRNPNVANSAVERSTELSNSLVSIWGDACDPIAPPACVFWAFCDQRLGPSLDGWILFGTPSPDPPNTKRTSPVPTELQVEQPALSAVDALLVDWGLQLDGKGLYPAQVIGLGGGPGGVDVAGAPVACMRAIELPEMLAVPFNTGLVNEIAIQTRPQALESLHGAVAGNRWLRFHTGASNRTRLLLGVNPGLLQPRRQPGVPWLVIRERDGTGALVSETPLEALKPVTVTGVADLPATWHTVAPWYQDVTSILVFLNTLKLVALFVEVQPKEPTRTIEVAVTGDVTARPSVVVAAVEACPASETARYQNGVVVQASTIKTIQTYLDGGTPVPLLEKDQTYTITVHYDVTVTEQDGKTNDYNDVVQAYQFGTHTKPPSKLDPWILCSSPDMNEQHVFYEDPVDVIFNDNAIIQLFGKYGYQLQMDLRAADGLPEVTGAPVTTVSINGVGTAMYDSMQQLVADGKLPCVGATSQYENDKFTAPVKLRPLMGYTLDLNTHPSLTPAPDPKTAVTPLFRRTFATSKYATMKALADDLGATAVRHRPLTKKLTLPMSPDPQTKSANVVADQDIQQAFLDAGEQALPAPDKHEIVIYWGPFGPGNTYVPHAILLDCTEPLWRHRPEPTFTMPIPDDKAFKLVEIGPTTSLEVMEQGGPSIAAFTTSPAGTRTVAMFTANFSPPPQGAVVTLALHRPASTVYGNADEADVIVALPVAPKAPWESDHV